MHKEILDNSVGIKCSYFLVFFFKQKTAYEMRISDWSSDVCSSDLLGDHRRALVEELLGLRGVDPAPGDDLGTGEDGAVGGAHGDHDHHHALLQTGRAS